MPSASNLCFACMHPLASRDAVCPVCGYDNHIRTNGAGLLPETLLNGQYLVGRVLGRGGFGISYIGYDIKLDRVIAIKEFFPSHLVNRDSHSMELNAIPDSHQDYQKGCQKALREGRMAAKLGQIPGIVQVYNVFSENNTIYIVMEYIDGVTLSQFVRNAPGRIALQDAITLLTPVAEALCRLHETNVIHRDVKPDNIMIRTGSQKSVLLDFGAARDRDGSTLSRSAAVISTGYTPVEQYNSYGMDGRIDEYAFCATLYFTLTGEAPPESILRLVEKNQLSLCNANSTVTPQTEAVILKGLAVMAANRYPSMQEMWNALLAPQRKQGRFSAKKAAAVAVSAAIIAGSAGYFVLREKEVESTAVVTTNTPVPTAAPTVVVTETPTAVPTHTPTFVSIATPTVLPTPTPTAVPTATPTVVPTHTPTAVPMATPTAAPTPTPTAMPTPTLTTVPTATPVPTPLVLVHPEIQVGSRLTLGRYEQDNEQANGKEPIEWIVLDRKGNQVMMLSQSVLDSAHSFDNQTSVWENSALQKWLNNYFLLAAFTQEEKDVLVSLTSSPDDYAFVLSVDEITQFYPNEADRKAKATPYVQSLNLRNLTEEGYCSWWLRSSADSANKNSRANIIRSDGNISTSRVATRGIGVRPVIWVNLDSAVFANEQPFEKAVENTPVMPEIQAGSSITFGRFESDDDLSNGADPLEWQVLKRQGDKVLAITKEIIGMRNYTSDHPPEEAYAAFDTNTWETNWWRVYLNQHFAVEAFTAEELNAIPTVTVKAAEHPFEKTAKIGADTKDQFFVLSYDEVEKYFPTEESRKAQGMPTYTNELILEGHTRENTTIQNCWLLRSPRVDQQGFSYAMCGIDGDGKLVRKLNPLGWRPACWIDLSKAQDTVAPAKEEQLIPGWEVGTQFTLGCFKQDDDAATSDEPIEWQVIKREGNRVLALSKHVLHAMKYSTESRSTWADSTLRQWLNGTFLSSAFSEREKAVLGQRTARAERRPDAPSTKDTVFVLSRTELEACLPEAADRIASPTPYAIAQKAGYVNKEGYCWWWLRSSPKGVKYSNTVKNDGKFDSRQVNFATYIGVRPAIWLNLDAEDFSETVHPID